jgi:hypothetical protein
MPRGNKREVNSSISFIACRFFGHPIKEKGAEEMDNKTIDSPEQTNQALENDQLERSQITNEENEKTCHTGAAEKVDKKLDGPNRPSV